MISSALRPFLTCLGNFLGMRESPETSRVKRSSEALSRITPLISLLVQSLQSRSIEAYPRIISSFNSSRPFWTSVTSTFFLHAFLPFRDGCLNCFGASPLVAAFDLTTGILNGTAISKTCLYQRMLKIQDCRRYSWWGTDFLLNF